MLLACVYENTFLLAVASTVLLKGWNAEIFYILCRT